MHSIVFLYGIVACQTCLMSCARLTPPSDEAGLQLHHGSKHKEFPQLTACRSYRDSTKVRSVYISRCYHSHVSLRNCVFSWCYDALCLYVFFHMFVCARACVYMHMWENCANGDPTIFDVDMLEGL